MASPRSGRRAGECCVALPGGQPPHRPASGALAQWRVVVELGVPRCPARPAPGAQQLPARDLARGDHLDAGSRPLEHVVQPTASEPPWSTTRATSPVRATAGFPQPSSWSGAPGGGGFPAIGHTRRLTGDGIWPRELPGVAPVAGGTGRAAGSRHGSGVAQFLGQRVRVQDGQAGHCAGEADIEAAQAGEMVGLVGDETGGLE